MATAFHVQIGKSRAGQPRAPKLATALAAALLAAPSGARAGDCPEIFTTGIEQLGPVAPWSIELADVDGDGDLDVLVTHSTGSVIQIGRNEGAGIFTFLPPLPAGGAQARDAIFADMNGDGHLDIVVACQNSVGILFGDGAGAFSPVTSYPAGGRLVDVIAADFNGDGFLDVAAVTFFEERLYVFMNNGDGTLLPPTEYIQFGDPTNVKAADLNGDGHLDLVIPNWSGGNTTVRLNDGAGGFAAAANYVTGDASYAVAIADFNGDGIPDLAVSLLQYTLYAILLGVGDGTFGAFTFFPTGAGPWDIQVADFDLDGILDLAIVVEGGLTRSEFTRAWATERSRRTGPRTAWAAPPRGPARSVISTAISPSTSSPRTTMATASHCCRTSAAPTRPSSPSSRP